MTFDIYASGDVTPSDVHVRIARARAILQRADATFSTWIRDSPINRLRRGEIGCEQAPTEIAQVLEACATVRSISKGWFDPWAMPGGLDPTGYVKGWAAQRALDALITAGVTGALINAAGDIATHGCPETAKPFRVGIVDPHAPRHLACVVEVPGAIATSGTYERGKHLIDPRSGQPRSPVASASVVGPELGLADALATALAVAGEDGLEFVDALEGYHGFIIGRDGSWLSTAEFPFAPDSSGRAILHAHNAGSTALVSILD